MSYVLTNSGKALINSILSGAQTPITYYLTSGSNPGAQTSEETDIALFSEVGPRVIGTTSLATTNTTNDTLVITGSYLPSSAISIAEAGVSNSVTVPTVGILQPSSSVIGSLSGTQIVTNTPLSPGNGGYIQIRTEVMKVTAGSGTTTLTVLRAQNGTTAISTIAVNDPVAQGNIPGGSTVTGGTLLSKANFTALNLAEGDSLVYTWSIIFQ